MEAELDPDDPAADPDDPPLEPVDPALEPAPALAAELECDPVADEDPVPVAEPEDEGEPALVPWLEPPFDPDPFPLPVSGLVPAAVPPQAIRPHTMLARQTSNRMRIGADSTF